MKGQRTFKNTIEPLAKVDHEFASMVTPMLFLKSVSPNKELREAAMAADKAIETYDIKEGMNDELYKALKDFK